MNFTRNLPRHIAMLMLAMAAFLYTVVDAGQPTAPGGCNSADSIGCPARDDITPVSTGYDPKSVNWDAVVADIEKIGNHEPRFCSFVIRAWFHDSMSIIPKKEQHKNPFNGGTDASFLTDPREFFSAEGALHGFTQYARHVVVQLTMIHGTSLSDMLMVASSKCTNLVLGGKVDIASHCQAKGLPLHVGKLDHEVDGTLHANAVLNKVESIPIPHNRMSHMMQFFVKDVNSHVTSGENWKISATDVMAIMGSHTLMMAQACTTTGEQKPGLSIDDRTCGGSGGRQRMFTWDNSFYQDISAGVCDQNSDMENRREFSLEQHQAFTMCGFDSMEGFELAEHLQCDAEKEALAGLSSSELDILHDRGPFGKGWHHVIWRPDEVKGGTPGNKPAPCCGHQCETCETNPESKFWCAGRINGDARMWPYTYMDCEFNWVYNLGGKGYCDGSTDKTCGTCGNSCNNQWVGTFGNQRSEMEMLIQEMTDSIERFRVNSEAWEEAYAEAFCKMSDFGTTFAPGKAPLTSVLGGGSGGGCLAPETALSLKQCATCDLEEFGPFSNGGGSNPPPPPTDPPVEPPMEDTSYDAPMVADDEYTPRDGQTFNDSDLVEEEEEKTETTSEKSQELSPGQRLVAFMATM